MINYQDKPMYQVYDSQIIANIRGGRSIKLIVHGEADIPTVEILQEEFNFGGESFIPIHSDPLPLIMIQSSFSAHLICNQTDVQIGGFCEREVTLQNNGTIPAIMYLDFSDYEDFYVSSIPDYLGESTFLKCMSSLNIRITSFLEARPVRTITVFLNLFIIYSVFIII